MFVLLYKLIPLIPLDYRDFAYWLFSKNRLDKSFFCSSSKNFEVLIYAENIIIFKNFLNNFVNWINSLYTDINDKNQQDKIKKEESNLLKNEFDFLLSESRSFS